MSVYQTKYTQYKTDTSHLATWLARAAIQAGHPIDDFDLESGSLPDAKPPSSAKTATQRKNAQHRAALKEKKAAMRDAERQANGQTQPTRTTPFSKPATNLPTIGGNGKYTLRIGQFVSLARYLVTQRVKIPHAVIRLLHRCIRLRHDCSEQFEGQASLSFDNHEHFVNVLEQVAQILSNSGLVEQPTKREKRKRRVKVHVEPVPDGTPNRFATLNVEETEDDDSEIEHPPPPPGPAGTTAPDISFDLLLDPIESIIMVLIFFEDVHCLRKSLKKVWQDYADHKVSLATAAVATNTVLELLREAQEDIESRILKVKFFSGEWYIVIWFLVNLLSGNMEGTSKSDGLPGPLTWAWNLSPKDERTMAIYDLLLVPTTQCLHTMASYKRDNEKFIVFPPIPLSAKCTTGEANNQSSFRERVHRTSEQISIFLTQYLTMAASIKPRCASPDKRDLNLTYLDQMGREARRFSKTRKLNLHIVVCAQVFVDIHRVLGDKAHQALDDLKEASWLIFKLCEERDALERGGIPPSYDRENDYLYAAIKAESKCWIELPKTQIGFTTAPDMHEACIMPDDMVVPASPLFCGIVLYRLQLMWRQLGLNIASIWETIFGAAHIFQTVKHSGGSVGRELEWPDMDRVFELHGKESMFGGKIPSDPRASQACYMLMTGSTLRGIRALLNDQPSTAREKRHTQKTADFKDPSRLLPIIYEKYLKDLDVDVKVNRVMVKRIWEAVTFNNQDTSAPIKQDKRDSKGPQKPFVTEVLSVLTAALEQEAATYKFDYMVMHMQCIRVLQRVRKDCMMDYREDRRGPGLIGYLAGEMLGTSTRENVGWILWPMAAVAVEKALKEEKQQS